MVVEGVIGAQERDSSWRKRLHFRVLAGEYFLNDLFSFDYSACFLENGRSITGEISNYGKFNQAGRWKEDFISLMWYYCLFMPCRNICYIGFVIIWVKVLIIPLPPQYQYAKYYLWYLLFTVSYFGSVYHYHYLILHCFRFNMVFQKE